MPQNQNEFLTFPLLETVAQRQQDPEADRGYKHKEQRAASSDEEAENFSLFSEKKIQPLHD